MLVLESMDPDPDPDPDHDGDMERRGGGLQHVRGNIRELLPEEERMRRRKEERRARWAIDINVVANVALLAGKIAAVLSTCSLSLVASLVASLVDSALDLLCTLIVWSNEPARGMAARRAAKAVSRGAAAPRTSGHTGVFYHHGYLLSADPAGVVRAEVDPATWRARDAVPDCHRGPAGYGRG